MNTQPTGLAPTTGASSDISVTATDLWRRLGKPVAASGRLTKPHAKRCFPIVLGGNRRTGMRWSAPRGRSRNVEN
jgi:hypothetical protein